MHTIIFSTCIVVIALSFYAWGRRAEQQDRESTVTLNVEKNGFPFLAQLAPGKSIRIKNTSKVRIVVIPDANSYLGRTSTEDTDK